MPAFIKNLTFDCDDALRVARFWAAALGSDVDEGSTPERAYLEAPAWGGPNIWFRGGRGPKAAPTASTSTSAPSPPWARRSTACVPLAPWWWSDSTTSPPCATPRAMSSASNQAQATPMRPRDADAMGSTTVRVSTETHDVLRKLAAATGEPLQRVLERAVENYRREQFYAEFNAAFERPGPTRSPGRKSSPSGPNGT
jgi:Glyoxalase-like domain